MEEAAWNAETDRGVTSQVSLWGGQGSESPLEEHGNAVTHEVTHDLHHHHGRGERVKAGVHRGEGFGDCFPILAPKSCLLLFI